MPSDSNWKTPAVRRVAEQLVDRRVVEGQAFQVGPLLRWRFDRIQRVVDQGQRLEPQEIHLEQADLLDLVLGPLGRDLVAVLGALVQRRELDDRLRAR